MGINSSQSALYVAACCLAALAGLGALVSLGAFTIAQSHERGDIKRSVSATLVSLALLLISILLVVASTSIGF